MYVGRQRLESYDLLFERVESAVSSCVALQVTSVRLQIHDRSQILLQPSEERLQSLLIQPVAEFDVEVRWRKTVLDLQQLNEVAQRGAVLRIIGVSSSRKRPVRM